MKKFLMFVIIGVIVFPLFAQEDWGSNRQFAITTNPSPLIIGMVLGGFGLNLGFEYAPIQQFAGKFNIQYVGFDPLKWGGVVFDGDDSVNTRLHLYMLRMNLEGRWYPQSRYVHGWFVLGGLQYHRLGASASVSLDDFSANEGAGFDTVGIVAGVGYKAIFGSGRAGFVFEPMLDITFPIFSDIPFRDMDVIARNMLGILLGVRGVRAGLLFGVAF